MPVTFTPLAGQGVLQGAARVSGVWRLGSAPPPYSSDLYLSPNQGLPSLKNHNDGFAMGGVSNLDPSPISVRLHDYQEEFVEEMTRRYLLGQDRGLLVLPTGAGKTISAVALGSQLIKMWKREYAHLPPSSGNELFIPSSLRRLGDFVRRATLPPQGILFVSHRDFLVRQAASEFASVFGSENVGILQGKKKETGFPIVIAEAQTLATHSKEFPSQRFGLLILDEAHHYVPENEWSWIIKEMGFLDPGGEIRGVWPKLMVGMTATPDRLNGTPLISLYGPEGLIMALDSRDLWDREDRVLLKPQALEVRFTEAINTISGKRIGSELAHLFHKTLKKKSTFHHTLVYVSRTAQVPEVVKALNRSGINADGLTEETPYENRREILDLFRNGSLRVLVNVGVAGEGFDVPSVETVVLAFSSESRTRVVQAIGRAMRPDPKNPEKKAWVVDFGGNLRRHRLNIQIREAYEAEGATLLSNEPAENEEKKGREQKDPSLWDFIDQVLSLPLQGEKPITTSIENAFRELGISEKDIQKGAYRLGISSDLLFAYANGLRVPSSLSEVIHIARELGDTKGILQEAWGEEKALQMEINDPFPSDFGPRRSAWVRYLRKALWLKYEGVVSRVAGTKPETVRHWLNEGEGRENKREIRELTAARTLSAFALPGRMGEAMELLNQSLDEKGYPLFEEWMIRASTEDILLFRLKQLASEFGRSPTAREIMTKRGFPSTATYVRAFGSFNGSLEACGLDIRK